MEEHSLDEIFSYIPDIPQVMCSSITTDFVLEDYLLSISHKKKSPQRRALQRLVALECFVTALYHYTFSEDSFKSILPIFCNALGPETYLRSQL